MEHFVSKKTTKQYFFLFLKGFAMGIADIIPGVSGGTIAFISGIYEELLHSISRLNLQSLTILKNKGFKHFWKHINGSFLLTLLLGILCGLIIFAKFISYLLEHYTIFLWAFFFGLVLASLRLVIKQITYWNFITFGVLLLGVIISYWITTLPGLSSQNNAPWFLFLSGALAVCAMILPGISGSFILVLLGSYPVILNAVHQRDFQKICMVALGVITGLLSFSKMLHFLFKYHKNIVMAFLTGFIIGALNKIYPWKILGKNVSPFNFESDPYIFTCIFIAFLGGLSIFILEYLSKKNG